MRGVFFGCAHDAWNCAHGILCYKVSVAAGKSVFPDIQSRNLLISGYAEADGVFDCLENNNHSHNNPGCSCKEADELYT